LTQREAVDAIRRGPIALVEDVLDIELRLPGLGDLRVDAGVDFRVAKVALVMNDLVATRSGRVVGESRCGRTRVVVGDDAN
jgi:hypothetical protein